MAYERTRSILRERNLAPHKRMGQNFLVHQHTARRIVELAAPGSGDVIIEVGVGLGALTGPIAARVRRVIGIEADSGLIRLHEEKGDLADNVTLVHGDILKQDLEQLAAQAGGTLKIIANLPYSISSPFLFRLLDHRDLIDWAVVMLQKEVALRLTAAPGTREYGVPSLLFGACATITRLLDVRPSEFHPRPRVDSQVIKITFQPGPAAAALPPYDWSLLKKIVRGCFGRRRKTLLNGLASTGLSISKKELEHLIRTVGIEPTVRAEQLALDRFVALTNRISAFRREIPGTQDTP